MLTIYLELCVITGVFVVVYGTQETTEIVEIKNIKLSD